MLGKENQPQPKRTGRIRLDTFVNGNPRLQDVRLLLAEAEKNRGSLCELIIKTKKGDYLLSCGSDSLSPEPCFTLYSGEGTKQIWSYIDGNVEMIADMVVMSISDQNTSSVDLSELGLALPVSVPATPSATSGNPGPNPAPGAYGQQAAPMPHAEQQNPYGEGSPSPFTSPPPQQGGWPQQSLDPSQPWPEQNMPAPAGQAAPWPVAETSGANNPQSAQTPWNQAQGGYPQPTTSPAGHPQQSYPAQYQQQPAQTGGYPQQPTQPGGYPQQQTQTGGNQQQQTQTGGYPQQPTQASGYPQQQTQASGYPQQQTQTGGYQQQPTQTGGYPQQPAQTSDYPHNPSQAGGYPQQQGAPGNYQQQQAPAPGAEYQQQQNASPAGYPQQPMSPQGHQQAPVSAGYGQPDAGGNSWPLQAGSPANWPSAAPASAGDPSVWNQPGQHPVENANMGGFGNNNWPSSTPSAESWNQPVATQAPAPQGSPWNAPTPAPESMAAGGAPKASSSGPQSFIEFLDRNKQLTIGELVFNANLPPNCADAAMRLQELVCKGAIDERVAREAIKLAAEGKGLLDDTALSNAKLRASDNPDEAARKGAEILQQAGLLTAEDVTKAGTIADKSGGNLGDALVSLGKIDKLLLESAQKCHGFIHQGSMRPDQAIIALHYCSRMRAPLEDALSDLSIDVM